MGEIGAIWVTLGLKSSDLDKKLAESQKNLDAIGDKFQAIGKKLTVAGGAIVGTFGLMIKSTANYGDEMDEMSQRTGASVELLTGLDGALRKNGASAGDLAAGVKFLSGKMVDANNGNKEAIALFEGLGISVTDANGNLRSTTDVLFDVATRFKGMESGAVKTTAAVDLLGRGGMSLIPTLNLGAEGLKLEADEASRLGKVMTAEAAKACSDFNDNLVNLRGGLQGVGIQIGQALMPVVQNLVKGMTDAVIKAVAWTKSHEDLTRVLATTTLAVGGIMTVLGPMLYMLPGLIKSWQTLTAVLKLSTVGLAASVVGLTAVVAAAGVAYDVVTRLTNAKNAATDADYRAFESNQKLGQKLREVADAAGLTRAEFHQLSLKYDENNAAMAMAIKKGTEGKTLQEALATVGKEHAAVIEEQKKKMAEMDPVMRALQETLKKTKETTTELVETWAPNAQGMILLANGAISARRLMDEFGATITKTVCPAARNLASEIKAVGDMMPKIPQRAKPAVETTKNYFDGLFNDIAAGFGNTIQSWLSGAKTFKNFMEGLWGNIKDSFFRMIGQMIAEWAIKFVKNIIETTREVGTSIVKNVGKGLDDVGGKVKGLGATIGEFIGGIGEGIGQFIKGIATGVAEAAKVLAGAAPDLMIVGAIALALYAGFAAIRKFIGGASGGGGAGDGMGRVVERQDIQTGLLTMIRDTLNASGNIKTTLWAISSKIDTQIAQLISIKESNWVISTATQVSRDFLRTIAGYLKDIAASSMKLNAGFAGIMGNLGSMGGITPSIKEGVDNIKAAIVIATKEVTAAITAAREGVAEASNNLKRVIADTSLSPDERKAAIIIATKQLEVAEEAFKQAEKEGQDRLKLMGLQLVSAKEASSAQQQQLNYQKNADGYLQTIVSTMKDMVSIIKDAVIYLKDIAGNTENIPGAASGAIVYTPQLARVAEREPEIIMPLREYRAGAGPDSGSQAIGGNTTTINLTINAQTLDDDTIRRAREKIFNAIDYEAFRRGRRLTYV